MAMNQQLPCGRDVDELWDHLDEAPDAHQRDCEHCALARERFRALAALTGDLGRREQDDPQLRIDAAVHDRVLAIARTEARRSRLLPLEAPGPELAAELSISEVGLGALVRARCDRTPGVRLRRVRASTASVLDDPSRAGVALELQVSIGAGRVIPSVIAGLRESIIVDVDRRTGMTVTRIDVAVEDLFDE